MKSVCIPFAALAASLTLLGGCASAPIVVSDSQLNWLQITCRPSAPGAPHCRINLIGVGYIEFIEGHSPRVANDFSLETDHARWQDAYQEKLGVPPDVIRDWLQLFADAGVMDSSKNRISHKEGGGETVLFQASINREKAICHTDDEELLDLVHKLIDVIKSQGKGRSRK